MEFQIKKRPFLKGPKSHKTTVSLTESMQNALASIASDEGNTVPEQIVEVLEQYLMYLVEQGAIPRPKDEPPDQTER